MEVAKTLLVFFGLVVIATLFVWWHSSSKRYSKAPINCNADEQSKCIAAGGEFENVTRTDASGTKSTCRCWMKK